MTDIVGILEGYAESLEWKFRYGNKSNQNLLRSNRIEEDIYLLLDHVTRDKSKSEFGGKGEGSLNGEFLILIKEK